MEIEERIIPVKDEPVHLRLLIYGDPGTEKTRFIASAVKRINPITGNQYRVLILDCNEKGTLSVRKFDPTGKYLRSFKVRGIQDLEHMFWYLYTNSDKWDIVAIDTTTELQWLVLRGVVEYDALTNDASRDILMPHKRDYGKTGEIMRMWISNYRNLPMHVVFTAHQRTEDADEESSKWPDVQDAVRNRLCGAVDIIGRSYYREINNKMIHCIYFGPHASWKTKERSGELPDEIKKPNLGDIIEMIQGSNKLREKQGKRKSEKNKKENK
jgi:hypothetical protein